MKYKKKLIEVALPLEAINKEAAREKSIRHGHPSTLHLWWARRPLAACRAVLFAQMVDDPSSHPDKFPTEEDQERERQRLFRIIEELVKWENSNNETVLERARAEIRKSCDGECPPVYDPFSGGGSIPLEAQRLGLKAYGSDLNPVAVMIGKALVEIPPKFAGKPPVNPDAQKALKKGGVWNHKRAQGLAEDVRYYGRWMRDEAEKRIGHLYPQVEVTEEMAKGRDDLKPLVGQKLTVIAWLWARTVASPNPALNNAHVPLVSSFLVGKKKGKEVAVLPVKRSDGRSIDYSVINNPTPEQAEQAKAGTKIGRGQFKCILSDQPIPPAYLKEEGKARRLGTSLMAVVVKGHRKRIYLPPEVAPQVKIPDSDFLCDIVCPVISGYFNPPIYGFSRVCDLFTDRQLYSLEVFSKLVEGTYEKCLCDCGDGDYAKSVALCLALGVSRMSNRLSSFSIWNTGGEKVEQIFSEQGVPMAWDFAEANPFSGATGSWEGSLGWIPKVIDNGQAAYGQIVLDDATQPKCDMKDMVVSTDPPYYSSITYADFSDFFYGTLRASLRKIYPKVFATISTPKKTEVVAAWHRFGGDRVAAGDYFTEALHQSILNACKRASDKFPIAIYYAFKSKELQGGKEALVTAWESILNVILSSKLSIESTWPLRTEQTGGRKAAKNTLASSIVINCRKRTDVSKITTRSNFIKMLNEELPSALSVLQRENIAPVDMAQAAIGPGMSIFSRFEKVLESDDTVMGVRSALQLINSALDEYFSEQEAEYDADTRFAITWFEEYGMTEGEAGKANLLANARNVSVAGVQQAGLIQIRGNKVRLLSRDEMPVDWDPASDSRLAVWEATQHLIRVMQAEGEQAAASLLAKLGSMGEVAKDLAYRLYGICERKKWADEGLAYNSLVISWPELTRLAAASDSSETETQSELEL